MNSAAVAALMGHSRLALERYYVRSPVGRDWFARAAAERRLRETLDDAAAHLRAVELEAYRDYHGATVSSASSLALALFRHEHLNLEAAAWGLRPDGDACSWLVGPDHGGGALRALQSRGKVPRRLRRLDELELFLHSGHVVRRSRRSLEALGIRLSDHGLEVGIRLPGFVLRTAGDEATVFVDMDLPETARAALVGRPLSALIDHPVLRDPALVVLDVDGLAIERSLPSSAWSMVVRAPREPWCLPWARGSR